MDLIALILCHYQLKPFKMNDSIDEEFLRISKEDWAELIALITEIEKTDYSSVVTGWDYPEIVSRFHDIVYDKKMILLFDWPKWMEARELLDDKEADFSELDLIKLCKLITVIVRNDRFSTGYLGGSFEDGIILKILYRIKQIIYEM